jgi:hypothetical protein
MQSLYTGSYALLVGVSRYDVPTAWASLETIPRELDDLTRALTRVGFERVERVTNPTGAQLRQAVQDFMSRYGYRSGTRLLLFFAGHGHTLDGGERGYFVPRDAPDPALNEAGFRSVALSMQQVSTWAGELVSRHAMFAFDSCFSGTIFRTRDRTLPARISEQTQKMVRQFMSAGGAGDPVPARSVFTPMFIRGLDGAADLDGDGFVTGTELGNYVQREVIAYKSGQTPQFGKIRDVRLDEGDMVFVVPRTQARSSPPPAPPSSDMTAERETTVLRLVGFAPDTAVWLSGRPIGVVAPDGTLTHVLAKSQIGEQIIQLERPGFAPMALKRTFLEGKPTEISGSEFAAGVALGVEYARTVRDKCEAIVNGRYPFVPDGSSVRDVSLQDFAELFGYGGVFEAFFATYLEKLVDTSQRSWKWRDSALENVPIQQFEAAYRIRELFFERGSRTPRVLFTMSFATLDNAERVRVEIDGNTPIPTYAHEAVRQWKMSWPGPKPGSAAVTFEERLKPAQSVSADGEWALFKLLDRGQLSRIGPERFRWSITVGSHGVALLIDALTVNNAFGGFDTLRNFKCGG